jgi:FkbM family methyltransferase
MNESFPLEIINFDEFEGNELRAIKKIVKNGWTVFDVGANIGWYSMNLAKSFTDVKVVAFEPVPSTYKYLLDNIALNDVPNVSAYNTGLSNEEGTKEMYFFKEGMGNASLKNVSERENVEMTQAQFTTMDIFASKHGVKPDFIKCDVEGAELFVFQGAKEVLKRDKPVVFTEMLRKWSAKFNYHPNDIIDLFSGLGYQCYTIEKDTFKKFDRVDEATVETNYLFIHPDKMSV